MKYSIRSFGILSLVAALAFNACAGGSSGGSVIVPDAPEAAALVSADSQLAVQWTAVDGATAYEVWYNTANDSSTASRFGSDATGTSAVITGLTNGTTYYVWLKAKNRAGTSDFGAVASQSPEETGTKITYAADSVSFAMVYVPGDLTFPTGSNDDGTATVTSAYWIGETEVTYELWEKVHAWATDAARGANQYSFGNAGTDTDQHPVTVVNWRDSIVWCNAATEWYNAMNGTSYACVYTYSDVIIRDSSDSNAAACDGAVAGTTAKGFRLLSNNEWELAARYRDGTLWTYGDHVSGDDSGACYDDGNILGGLGISGDFGNFAVYVLNSGSSSAVKSKTANSLGLYDMSGNVWEWCFTGNADGSFRIKRGGSWHHNASFLRVGELDYAVPDNSSAYFGIRVARTH